MFPFQSNGCHVKYSSQLMKCDMLSMHANEKFLDVSLHIHNIHY